MSRISELVKDRNLHVRAGLSGNWYAFSFYTVRLYIV